MTKRCRHNMPMDQNCGKCTCSGIDPRIGHIEHGGLMDSVKRSDEVKVPCRPAKCTGCGAELSEEEIKYFEFTCNKCESAACDKPKAAVIGEIGQRIAKHNAGLVGFVSVEDKLKFALKDLLEKYTQLVNCGDCGNWDPETEKEVIAARALLDE